MFCCSIPVRAYVCVFVFHSSFLLIVCLFYERGYLRGDHLWRLSELLTEGRREEEEGWSRIPCGGFMVDAIYTHFVPQTDLLLKVARLESTTFHVSLSVSCLIIQILFHTVI